MTKKEDQYLTERDNFIISKAKTFSVNEIQILLEREGFKKLGRTRIYQILEGANIQPLRHKRPLKK